MILNDGFFKPTGNCYNVAFTTESATIEIDISQEVWNNVRITNASGSQCFVQISTIDPTTIAPPEEGAAGSADVVCIPTGQTTFLNTGITAPAVVYISVISIAGSGSIFVQTGSFL